MTTLVIAEHDNASAKGATFNTVTAALQRGGDVHVLVAGANAAPAAAVDAGYAPNDWQVGQTGMKDCKVIVVINKDPKRQSSVWPTMAWRLTCLSQCPNWRLRCSSSALSLLV